jgi:hypothetical protein
LAKCQENHFEAVWQNARKIILRQFSKMPGKSFSGSLAKCQEYHFEAVWQNARKIISRQIQKEPMISNPDIYYRS